MIRRILVADPDQDCRDIHTMALEHAGFEVLCTGDGGDALRLAYDHQPAAVILELGLPGLDGLLVIRMVRAEQRTRDIRIIVITDRPGSRAAAEAAGCDSYFFKPVAPSHVLEAMKQLLPNLPAS